MLGEPGRGQVRRITLAQPGAQPQRVAGGHVLLPEIPEQFLPGRPEQRLEPGHRVPARGVPARGVPGRSRDVPGTSHPRSLAIRQPVP